jgi:hypothetical protein
MKVADARVGGVYSFRLCESQCIIRAPSKAKVAMLRYIRR